MIEPITGRRYSFYGKRTLRTRHWQYCQRGASLEPHIYVAYLDRYERLIVVSSTQVPYYTRRQLAAVLELPISRIRVVKPRVGGHFGIKQEMLLEPVAAILAMKTIRNLLIIPEKILQALDTLPE